MGKFKLFSLFILIIFFGVNSMAGDLHRVTDIPATQGAHVVTTYGGATKGWNTQSGFDFNDISSFQVIQPYLANITTAFTYFKVFTIDDGQPAADQALASEWIDSNGLRKWKVEVLTTGKIKISGSSDGADNSEDETTDSAFFTDGAQSKASIMVTYNGTSYAIYGDGSLLASTTGAGGVPASLYDGGAIYTLNALGDYSSKYDGDDQTNLLFNAALSADQGKRLDRAYRK